MSDNSKELNELKIFKNSKFAGILKRTAEGSEFSFDQNYLQNARNEYFSYRLKITEAKIKTTGDNLHPFFAGLLPEGRRLSAIVRKLKTSEDDLFSIFAATGVNCIGDIDTGANEIQLSQLPKIKDVNFYNFFEELVNPEVDLLDDHALAGVQEKISASMISFPLNVTRKDKDYILKLNQSDKKNLVTNELICLNLAKKCGFKVSTAKIVEDKDSNLGLLVERFDRLKGVKLHQEDACQFLNLYPSEKYRVSLNQIAEALVQLTNAPQIEIINLLRQYMFSYLLCNGDLHAKNISLYTLEDGTVTLTPSYDVISTAIYGDYKMALKIDGRDDNIKRKNIIEFANRFDVNSKAMNSAIDKLLKLYISHHHTLYEIPMEKNKMTILQTMIAKRIEDLS